MRLRRFLNLEYVEFELWYELWYRNRSKYSYILRERKLGD